MKLKFAIVGLAALFGLAAAGSASAMPVAPLSPASNVENVVVACGPSGCIRTAPVYRGYGYGYPGYGYRGGVHRYGHVHTAIAAEAISDARRGWPASLPLRMMKPFWPHHEIGLKR